MYHGASLSHFLKKHLLKSAKCSAWSKTTCTAKASKSDQSWKSLKWSGCVLNNWPYDVWKPTLKCLLRSSKTCLLSSWEHCLEWLGITRGFIMYYLVIKNIIFSATFTNHPLSQTSMPSSSKIRNLIFEITWNTQEKWGNESCDWIALQFWKRLPFISNILKF